VGCPLQRRFQHLNSLLVYPLSFLLTCEGHIRSFRRSQVYSLTPTREAATFRRNARVFFLVINNRKIARALAAGDAFSKCYHGSKWGNRKGLCVFTSSTLLVDVLIALYHVQ
jgi:hypothetical protein